MSLITGCAIYFIVWWITLFIVLPFGIERDRNVESGNDPGAPTNHGMMRKLIANTLLAFVIWLIIYTIDTFDIITIKDII